MKVRVISLVAVELDGMVYVYDAAGKKRLVTKCIRGVTEQSRRRAIKKATRQANVRKWINALGLAKQRLESRISNRTVRASTDWGSRCDTMAQCAKKRTGQQSTGRAVRITNRGIWKYEFETKEWSSAASRILQQSENRYRRSQRRWDAWAHNKVHNHNMRMEWMGRREDNETQPDEDA